MATRPWRRAGQEAVDRARARIPGLVPASAEVVELVRGVPYVVVRTAPAGIVVLDARGRMVRRRELLAAIARHLHSVESLARAVADACLDRRLEHTVRSVELLGPVEGARALVSRLLELRARIEAVLGAAAAAAPPTERTVRRRAAELNDAARADREVVREARLVSDERARRAVPRSRPDVLERWLRARLASPDLPFFHPELVEAHGELAVERFLRAVRR